MGYRVISLTVAALALAPFVGGCDSPKETIKGERMEVPLADVWETKGRCSFRLYYQGRLLTYSSNSGTMGDIFEKCPTLRKGDLMTVIKTTRFVDGQEKNHWYHWQAGDMYDKLM